ncbi:HAMP domain-containing sensor histidine kinase [Nocardioides mangrovi]|uniref:histidine kinase n=1 Tax=Nocardioides mangrovi TaxID=2874580 RepID=A0ABS7UDN2_9ACTN|nr:HAMP domain-containing sensor histidine kinase [Nocardioides mangrovi]MBZ5739113.1 HAMP domain-containing histidine kinase [Nocardioides mangrovi]
MSTRRPLAVRLVLALGGVAVLVALVVAGLLAPLLSGASDQAVRESMARQADLLARLPAARLVTPRAERIAGRTDLQLGVVTRTGARVGAAQALTDAQVDELLAGGSVSADGTLDGVEVVLEARPARDGGAVVVASDESASTSLTDLLRRRVLLAILLGLAAAGLTAWVVARRMSRPLGQAADVARRMAAGERGLDLPEPDSREAGDLVDALGALDRALAASEGRQHDFLLSVSHELRTPLTTVRGYAEALADGVIAPEETTEVGALLRTEADRLARYVADLLALARMESDDFALSPAPADLADLVRTAAAAWAPAGEAAGVTVTADVPASTVVVTTDAARVRQVLDALTDNAVRICPPGARVVLALDDGPGGVRLQVRDSGPGLTADDARVAFEPGVLHDRYAGARPGGHGLGLAIVGRLVTHLGGRIRVEAAAEGGAAFVIDLPRD